MLKHNIKLKWYNKIYKGQSISGPYTPESTQTTPTHNPLRQPISLCASLCLSMLKMEVLNY